MGPITAALSFTILQLGSSLLSGYLSSKDDFALSLYSLVLPPSIAAFLFTLYFNRIREQSINFWDLIGWYLIGMVIGDGGALILWTQVISNREVSAPEFSVSAGVEIIRFLVSAVSVVLASGISSLLWRFWLSR